MSAPTTCRVFRPDPATPDSREEHRRGRFSACNPSAATVMVTVEGEIDATNSRVLADYVERHVTGTTRLVLDLQLVDFFGTAGFAALHNVNVMCSRYGVEWALVAGRQVRRLLLLCDPDGTLPLAQSRSILDDVRARAGDREFLVGRDHQHRRR
jgi:anti-anti-sigma factor